MSTRTHKLDDAAFAENDENYENEVPTNVVLDADIFHQPLTRGNSSRS